MLDLDLLYLLFGESLHLFIFEAFQFILKESLLAAIVLGLFDLFYIFYGLLKMYLCLCQSTGLGHGIVECC